MLDADHHEREALNVKSFVLDLFTILSVAMKIDRK
jgi:hypothetical protein